MFKKDRRDGLNDKKVRMAESDNNLCTVRVSTGSDTQASLAEQKRVFARLHTILKGLCGVTTAFEDIRDMVADLQFMRR